MSRLLRVYAPVIVLVIFAVLEPITANTPPVIVVRLLVLAFALGLSIRENRREARHRRYGARF